MATKWVGSHKKVIQPLAIFSYKCSHLPAATGPSMALLEWVAACWAGHHAGQGRQCPQVCHKAARTGIALTARDQGMLGYRVPIPKEWATLTEEQRGTGSLAAFKSGSRAGFLTEYGAFVCCTVGCRVRQLEG